MSERLKTHSKTQKKSADLVSNKLRIGVFQRYQMKCKSVSKKSPRYTSISSYYTFYLMQKFGLSIQNAQLHLFAFLFAVAAGTVIGGPVGDKIGRKYVIWGSILGVAPFTLILPYASLHWTGVLTVIIGFILASAFSAILVYAQELLPGRIGMVSGLFFGFAFGMGGLGAAVLGLIADHTSIELVYKICAFLPLLGMLTIFLPDNRHKD